MYSTSENRQNAGETSKDFQQDRQTRSRTKKTTREDMLGSTTVKSTELRKLLDLANSLQKLDLVGAKKEYDAFMEQYHLESMRDSEDRYFPPTTSPTQERQNDDYYRNKYKQLQREKEDYQAKEASLNTEIERLTMELERNKEEIKHIKGEAQKVYMSKDSSGDAPTIKILKHENDKMKRIVEETKKTSKEKEEEHTKWIKTMSIMKKEFERELAELKKELAKTLQREEEHKKRLKDEEIKTKAAEEAKLQALTRLSKEMGSKLNDNNPAIADLSDPNRATKLAEMYSEIYDNDWTDALEELDSYGYTEEIAIRLLLDVVKKADEFCKKKAEDQMRGIEDSFFMSDSDRDKGSSHNKKNIIKILKDQRKSTAGKYAEKIYKEFSTLHGQKHGISQEYVKKIVKLCWLMAVQDPPVCFGKEAKAYDKLDTNNFRPYTQTGTEVSFTVWLPMFLHKEGPLLSKGVAQPVSFRAKSAPASTNRTDRMSRPIVENPKIKVSYIQSVKHAWEQDFETNTHYNETMRNYHQANDDRFDRHTTHSPRNEFSTSIHNPDTRKYMGTTYSKTYSSPKYDQKTISTQRHGDYQAIPSWKY